MSAEEAHDEICAELRSRLTALAHSHSGRVEEQLDFQGYGVVGTRFLLRPTRDGATEISVFPEDAYTTWVQFGYEVVNGIFTSPKKVRTSVDRVMEVIEAVAAGRAPQRLWFGQKKTEPIGPRPGFN